MSDTSTPKSPPKTYPTSRKTTLNRKTLTGVSGGARLHTKPTKVGSKPTSSVPQTISESNMSSSLPLAQESGNYNSEPNSQSDLSVLADPLSPIIPVVFTSSSLITMTTATITTTSLREPITVSSVFHTAVHDNISFSNFSSARISNTSKGSCGDDRVSVTVRLPTKTKQETFIMSSSDSEVEDNSQMRNTTLSRDSHAPSPILIPPTTEAEVFQAPEAMEEDARLQGIKRKPEAVPLPWADDFDISSGSQGVDNPSRLSGSSFPLPVQRPKHKRTRSERTKRSLAPSSSTHSQSAKKDDWPSLPPPSAASLPPGKPNPSVQTATLPFTNHGPSTSAGTRSSAFSKPPVATTGGSKPSSNTHRTQPDIVVSPKRTRLPPIVCSGELSPTALKDLKQLTPLFEAEFEARHTNSRAVFYMRTPKDHKQMVSFLLSKGVPLHSWTLPEDRNARLVIRGLHIDTPITHIEEALAEHNIQCTNISRMRSRGSDPVDWPLFLVTLAGTAQLQTALKISHLGRIKVTLEIFRGTLSVVQCFQCQGYGHTSHHCHERPICVKCAGDHRAADCCKTESEPCLCCNCQGDHPANYSLCPRRSQWLARRNASRAQQQASGTHATAISSTPTPAPPSAPNVNRDTYAGRVRGGPQTRTPPTSNPQAHSQEASSASSFREILELFQKLNLCHWLGVVKDLLQRLTEANSIFDVCSIICNSLLAGFSSPPAESVQ